MQAILMGLVCWAGLFCCGLGVHFTVEVTVGGGIVDSLSNFGGLNAVSDSLLRVASQLESNYVPSAKEGQKDEGVLNSCCWNARVCVCVSVLLLVSDDIVYSSSWMGCWGSRV